MKEQQSDIIIGRNPVIEALKNDREIEKLIIGKGAGGSAAKILGMAKDKNITIYYNDKETLDRIAGGGVHQGVIAYVSVHRYCEVEDILKLAKSRGEDPFIVILDNIEDPHNLGAIMRTAEAAGVHGIVIPKRRAAPVTASAVKASAGASEYLLCAKVSNITQTIEKLKSHGLWIFACDMEGKPYYDADLRGGICLVVGNEGAGIGKLVKEKCDFTLSIPMAGKISSLNASNAAAILIYEVRRQRNGK